MTYSFFSTFPYQITVDFSWHIRKWGLGSYFEYFDGAGDCGLCYGVFHIPNT